MTAQALGKSSSTYAPAPSWPELIRHEHRQAELERLRAGYDGCGCSECQEIYKTIDPEKYGKRVICSAGVINITAGRAGADLWEKYHLPDPPTTVVSPSVSPEGVTKIPTRLIIPPTDIQAQNNVTTKRLRGRPKKPDGEPVCRMTRWRRGNEVKQGALL